LVPRIRVVEGLFRQELTLEQAPVPIEIGLRQLQIRFPLPDRCRRHRERRLRLSDLFLNLPILDLGDHLTAPHGVAELDVDGLQPSVDLGHGLYCGRADQVAHDEHALAERRARGGRELHRHGRPRAPAAPSASRGTAACGRIGGGRLFAAAVHHETREGHHGNDYDNDSFAHALLEYP
jgi:hypothetical protein